ncbi:hypothetical protein D9M72_299420 [compost metagenome]
MSGTGCSAYSSPTADSRVSASTAAGTSQPPFASTRMAASGRALRTAATRAASSSSVWPRSATLILTASTRPKRARTSGTRSAGMAGTVALTGITDRSGGGNPCQPASTAEASQRDASASPYSGKGQNSPQPSGPSSRRASRCVMPRNFTRMGRLTTCAEATSCSTEGRFTAGRFTAGRFRGWRGASAGMFSLYRPRLTVLRPATPLVGPTATGGELHVYETRRRRPSSRSPGHAFPAVTAGNAAGFGRSATRPLVKC